MLISSSEDSSILEPLVRGPGDASNDHAQVENINEYSVYPSRSPIHRRHSLPGAHGIVSRLLFSWVGHLMERGFRQQQLDQEDLPPLPSQASPIECTDALTRTWMQELARSRRPNGSGVGKGQPSLLRALFRPFGMQYLALGVLKFWNDVLNFGAPIFLNGLLRYLDAAARSKNNENDSASAPLNLSSCFTLQSYLWNAKLYSPIWWMEPRSHIFGISCAALLSICLVMKAFLNSHFSYRQGMVSAQVKSALTGLVFSQTLALRDTTLASIGTGRVQTLMSIDTDRLANLCLGFHELWSLPMQICVALWLLYTQVQFAFLAGMVGVILVIPLNKALASGIQRASIIMMSAKDRRITTIAELLKGAKTIKAYGWEESIEKKVEESRRDELGALATRKYLDAVCVYLWAAMSLLFSLGTFGLYALMGKELTAQAVFTSLALFNVLLGPINSFPWVINGIVESVVSLRRLRDYLAIRTPPSPSTPSDVTLNGCTSSTQNLAIAIENGSFTWDSPDEENKPTKTTVAGHGMLHDINLSVTPGTFVAITGTVGSGKSSLLGAILGELQVVRGTVYVAGGGSMAYVPQMPWIMPGTARDNILLGLDLHPDFYSSVLHACALDIDFASMSAGDLTLVGELGSVLSGGQRTRIALARALYRAPYVDIFLLDDVLAAVDAHVARWLVENALRGPLLDGKTVLATTQSPVLLEQADTVVAMREGRIERVVEQQHKTRSGGTGAADSENFSKGGGRKTVWQHMAGLLKLPLLPRAHQGLTTPGLVARQLEDKGFTEEQEEEEIQSNQIEKDSFKNSNGQSCVEDDDEEARAIGHVRWKVYRQYMILQGAWVPITLVGLTLMQATRNGSDLWLSYWVSRTNDDDAGRAAGSDVWLSYGGFPGRAAVSNSSRYEGVAAFKMSPSSLPVEMQALFPSLDPNIRFYLTVLLILAAANSIFTLLRAFAFAQGGLVAARRLHARLLRSILAVPPAFFHSNPSGRVLNRFSSDTATADDSLPFIANIFLAQAFGLAGVAIVLVVTQPYLAIALLPMGLLYRSLQRYYRATSREIRRLEAVAKSPVYSAFSSVMSGGATIRAFGAADVFIAAGLRAVAAQQRAFLAGLAASTWLGIRLQLMAAGIAATVGGLAVAQSTGAIPGAVKLSATAGFVGLSLAYIMPITGLLNGILSSGAETEQEMVSVERIEQYTDLEPQQEMLMPSALATFGRGNDADNAQGLAVALQTSTQLLPSSLGGNGFLAIAGHALDRRPPVLFGGHGVPSRASDFNASNVYSREWPEYGGVVFRNVWLRYSPSLPFVIEGFNLDIEAGSHVGICGRTGAGKSSAMSCLLRLSEISAGEVLIDGVDVRTVPLKRLRRSVGYVPQSPFVMSGTVLENMDPIGSHSQEQVASALKRVHLWTVLVAHIHNYFSREEDRARDEISHVLALRLGEGGLVLSHGQQQMLCVGRVILKRPRVVCLDECSSSVDTATAKAMREVIHREFEWCTVVEIAHRLTGLADSDSVVVMESGRIVERGDPRSLVKNQESAFYRMVKEQVGGTQDGRVVL